MNKVLIKINLFIIMFMVTLFCSGVFASTKEIKLEVEGEPIELNEPVKLVNNRSLLPMRDFFELIGAKVTWDNWNKTATAKKDDMEVRFEIGDDLMLTNTGFVYIDVPAMIIDNKTYIPVRAAAEALGYDVLWEDNTIKMGYDLQSTFSQNVGEVTMTGSFDNQWLKTDRVNFTNLMNSSKEKVYAEYVGLARALEQVEQKAYRSKRGFVVYTPEVTTQVNAIKTAMAARGSLLKDMTEGKKASLNDYYPQAHYTQIVSYMNKTIYTMDEKGNIIDEKTEMLDLTLTDGFKGKDFNQIIQKLEQLNIPDYYFYGTTFYFISAYPTTEPTLGYNLDTSVRGFFDSKIVVYDKHDDMNELMSTVFHELGHNVEKEITKKYTPKTVVSDTENINAYLALYNNPAVGLAWGSRVEENLAEDFSYLYGGNKKIADWKTNNIEAVRQFFQNQMYSEDYSDVPVFKEIIIEADDAKYRLKMDGLFNTPYLVTNSREIKVTLDGMNNAEGTITSAFMSSAISSTAGKRWYFEGSSGTMEFSEGGLYNIQFSTKTNLDDTIDLHYMFSVEVYYIP